MRRMALFAVLIEKLPATEIWFGGNPGSATFCDRKNSEAVASINASGNAYLTQTKLRGRIVMRLGLGNILTAEEHVRRVWEMIRAAA